MENRALNPGIYKGREGFWSIDRKAFFPYERVSRKSEKAQKELIDKAANLCYSYNSEQKDLIKQILGREPSYRELCAGEICTPRHEQ